MENKISEVRLTSISSPAIEPLPRQEEALSPAVMAMQELQETSGSALYETLQEMGMALSGKLHEDKKRLRCEQPDSRQQALINIVQRIAEQNSGELHFPNSTVNSPAEMEVAQRIMAVAMALSAQGLSGKTSRSLKESLNALLAIEGWELTLFGMMELTPIDKVTRAAIKRLMQQAMDEDDIPLSEWFRRIAAWPDRRQRVRVLLRTMAFELAACAQGSQQRRLATVLVRLRRLLLFLGLEKECQREELICQLPDNSLLSLLIVITSEKWLFGDWLLEQLTSLAVSRRILNHLLHHLDVVFTLLPDACFNDDDQREQILGVIRELKGDQVLP